MIPGPYRCGCNASYGQSCGDCDGTFAEQAELRRDRQRAAGALARQRAQGTPAVQVREVAS